MIRSQLRAILSVLVLPLFINGCATYVTSAKLRQQAVPNLPFSVVLKNPDRYVGRTVIWGGIIIETINEPNSTMIKILQTPLGYGEEPESDTASEGRFIAKVPGYLDNQVYRPGKKVTVAGKIIGKQVQPLGQTTYAYPLVSVEEINLWQTPSRYWWPYYYWNYPVPFYWGWGWYGPP